MDRRIKIACKEGKEEWLGEKLKKVEQLGIIDSRMMAEKIREITGKKRIGRSTIMEDRDSMIPKEKNEDLNRRQQHVGDLHKDGN